MDKINSSTSTQFVQTRTSDMEELSSELFQKILPLTIFLTVLNCVGVPGNLLVLLVYLKMFKASSTRVFVLVIAVCDFLVNLLTIPLFLVYYRLMYIISSLSFCTVIHLVLRLPLYVSCLVLVCASLDRRRRVCQPLRRQLNPRLATRILFLPFGLAALAIFPFGAVQTGMHFNTTTGLSVRKCGFDTEFPGVVFKRVEGSLLAVYCVVGLTLLVGSYAHILYRVSQQNFRWGLGQPHMGIHMVTTSAKNEKSEEEVENTEVTFGNSRAQESCIDWLECEDREQKEEDPSVSASRALPARHGMSVGVHQSRKHLASKTTLVMFVLTITTVVCLTPYIIWTYFPETYYEPDMNSWVMNMSITFAYLPSLRSAINPFIYLYFNPKFRAHCRQVLTPGCLTFTSNLS